MAYMHKKVLLTLKLPQLQNLIKRDQDAYKEEFMMQKRHFDSELEIFKMRPTKDSERFTELVTFMCHVASCYKDETKDLPIQLIQLLEEHAFTLHPDVRAKLFQSLILLRNKSVLDPLILLRLSFKLFSVPDKTLRASLGEYIINDIKAINQTKHNDKLNRSVQAMLFNIVATENSISARKTVQILAELYRKRVWTDERTVNVIGSACLSPITRVFVSAINFFLGIENKMLEDEDDEKVINSIKEVDYHAHSKKTRKRLRIVKKQVEENIKKKKDIDSKEALPLFPAIQLLHDPQELAEKLFKKLKSTSERFEVKLLLMNFISRLIGCHQLLLLSFYSFLQKYLTSHQQNVTKILAYLIQACHELVPPEDIVPIVRAIAYNFITERCTTEVIAVGINAVREIIIRVPSILREDGMSEFVQDLVMYSKKAHKSVMIAAHSVLNLVRELYPALLRKGDRGKFHDPSSVPIMYGESRPADAIAGTELLEAYERGEIYIDDDDNVIFKDEDDDDGNNDDDDGSLESEDEDDDDDDDDDDEDDDELGWVDVEDDDAEEGDDDDNSDDNEDDEEEEIENENEDNDDDDDDEEEDDEDDEEEEEEEEEEEVDPANDSQSKKSKNKTNKNQSKSIIIHSQTALEKSTIDVESGDNHSIISGISTTHNKSTAIKYRVEAKRLLTAEDFDLINRLRIAQREREMDPKYRKKLGKTHNSTTTNTGAMIHTTNDIHSIHSSSITNNSSSINKDENSDNTRESLHFAIDPESLGPGVRLRKTTKIERITTVLEGRKENKFTPATHAGGLTNKEKERKKNFMMVRKGKTDVRAKIRKSNSDVRYDKMKKKKQYGHETRKRRRT